MKRSVRAVGWLTAVALIVASGCSPSGPRSSKANASDLRGRGPEDVQSRRRSRRVLHVRLRRSFGAGLCLRRAVDAASVPSRSSRPIRPPATASTTTRRRCWADLHLGRRAPSRRLSETNGDYDGRWLFVNEMNGRIARIDLRDFKTKQIFGPVPNVSGNHGSSFVTPNTEYAMMASRFSIPIPEGHVAPIDKYATDYKGVVAGIKIDPKSGDDDARLGDPDAAVRLGSRRRRQEGRPTAGCSGLLQHRAGDRQARGHRHRSATATTSRPSTGAPPRRPPPTARAT